MRWVKRTSGKKILELPPAEIQEKIAKHQEWERTAGEKGEKLYLNGICLKGVSWKNISLKGAVWIACDLQLVQMEDVNLSGAVIGGCLLQHSKISTCQFVSSKLFECDFTGAVIRDSQFMGAEIQKTTFKHTQINHSDFGKNIWMNVSCSDTSFHSVNWKYSSWFLGVVKKTNFINCHFTCSLLHELLFKEIEIVNSSLFGANVHLCQYKSFQIQSSDLSYSQFTPFPPVPKFSLSSCTLSYLEFPKKYIPYIDSGRWNGLRKVSDVQIAHKKLIQILAEHEVWLESHGKKGVPANLEKADLRQVDLSGVNLRAANLKGALLHGAQLAGTDFTGANLSGSMLKESNYQDANLEVAILDYSDIAEKPSPLFKVEKGSVRLSPIDKDAAKKLEESWKEIMQDVEGFFPEEVVAEEIKQQQKEYNSAQPKKHIKGRKKAEKRESTKRRIGKNVSAYVYF